jgi:hypothetical protein
MEYSEPKPLAGTKFYTQVIWDEANKKGYIAILTKNPDGTFNSKSNDLVKDFNNFAAVVPNDLD